MLVSNETLTTPNFYFWKWITEQLDETSLSSASGIQGSRLVTVISVVMPYRVLDTVHMVYYPFFTMHLSNGVNQSQVVIRLVYFVKN